MDWPATLSDLFWWAGGASLLGLLATVIGVPWVIARLPDDYFSQPQRAAWRESGGEPLLAVVLALAKNAFGAVLVVLGTIMLVTPGQGLLTILIGLLLLNFPGKYRLERWLVLRPGVLRGLNWLRARHGKAPFEAPPDARE